MALIPHPHPQPLGGHSNASDEEDERSGGFCPLCLRPFEDERRGAGALVPAYFRSLPPPTPLLHERGHRDDRAHGEEPDGDDDDAEGAGVPGFYAKYFVELHKAGHGSFGSVYVVRHIVEGISLGLFAVKKIPIGDSVEYLETAINEVRLLEDLHAHPNIIAYKHSWIEEDRVADFGPRVRCLFVLMELATEGSLERYLEEHGRRLSTTAVWYFFLSALSGLAWLHRNGILHRDINPNNILLTKDAEGRPPRVLVSDFGTATVLGRLSASGGAAAAARTGGTGTQDYMEPALKRVVDGVFVGQHSTATDVWAMGQLLHYLAFEGALADVDATTGAVRLRQTCARPVEMQRLIASMMDPSPPRRPSCAAILQTPQCQRLLAKFEANEWEDEEASPRQRVVPHQLLLQDSLRRTASNVGATRHNNHHSGGSGGEPRVSAVHSSSTAVTPAEQPSTPVAAAAAWTPRRVVPVVVGIIVESPKRAPLNAPHHRHHSRSSITCSITTRSSSSSSSSSSHMFRAWPGRRCSVDVVPRDVPRCVCRGLVDWALMSLRASSIAISAECRRRNCLHPTSPV